MTVGVRSTTTRVHGTAGKYYAEFKVDVKSAGVMRLGLKDVTLSVTDGLTCMQYIASDGEIRTTGSGVLANIGVAVSGDVVGLAWDSGAKTFWFRRNTGSWNNSGSADPATGAGGFAGPADTATYALWMLGVPAADQVTVRTEAADITLTPPAGFTSWMGETLGPAGVTLTADTGAVALAGVATGLRADRGMAAAFGAVAVAGVATGLRAGRRLAAEPYTDRVSREAFVGGVMLSVDLSGRDAFVGGVMFSGVGGQPGFLVTGQAVNLIHRHAYTLPITVGSVVVAFNDAGLTATGAKKLIADTGAVTVSMQAAALRHSYALPAVTGAIALGGQAVTLRYGHKLAAATGSVVLSGKDATLRHATVMPATTGAVALTGYAADLRKAGALGLAANTGAITLAGQAAALRYGHKLTAEKGAVLLSGQAATLRYGHKLTAAKGTVTLAGQAATLRYGHKLTAAKGAVTVTFNDAALRLRLVYRMIAAPGGIVVTGYPAALSTATNKTMVAATGAIVLSGKATALRTARVLPAATGPILLTGLNVNLDHFVRTHYTLDAAPGEFVLSGHYAELLANQRERQPGPLYFGRRVTIPHRW